MKQQNDIFNFLDSIKPTEIVNMFDTVPVITDTFNLNEQEARQMVSLWLRTFSERHLSKQKRKLELAN